jgi:hypothetical protein
VCYSESDNDQKHIRVSECRVDPESGGRFTIGYRQFRAKRWESVLVPSEATGVRNAFIDNGNETVFETLYGTFTPVATADSRYHRQRAESQQHPNRKTDEPHHDTTRPYPEVAAQIEDAIDRFKSGDNSPEFIDQRLRAAARALAGSVVEFEEWLGKALELRVHEAMGFKSWVAYLSDVVGEMGQLPPDRRRRVLAILAPVGMGQRDMADALNVSQMTISRDLDELKHDDSVVLPDKVIGRDGKERPAHPPTPPPPPPKPQPPPPPPPKPDVPKPKPQPEPEPDDEDEDEDEEYVFTFPERFTDEWSWDVLVELRRQLAYYSPPDKTEPQIVRLVAVLEEAIEAVQRLRGMDHR